jgi:hypothetical protein
MTYTATLQGQTVTFSSKREYTHVVAGINASGTLVVVAKANGMHRAEKALAFERNSFGGGTIQDTMFASDPSRLQIVLLGAA